MNMRRVNPAVGNTAVAGVVAGLLACAGGALAQSGGQTSSQSASTRERPGFDPKTGRSTLNYPPHRFARVSHVKVQARINDMNVKRMICSATLTVSGATGELSSLTLNAGVMTITGVSSPGREVIFGHDPSDEVLNVRLSPPVPAGEKAELTVSYEINDPPEGIVWTPESPAYPGRAAQLHSQGQPESNRAWFPSHDFPNDRVTSEIIVTVPRGFRALSNGVLTSETRSAIEPFDTFHWTQDKPHANYLVSLVVGKFDVVDVGRGGLSMPVYVPPGQAERVERTFGRTPAMVKLFESLVDEPYPWAKYAQASVYNFNWGGMENTSATTLYENVALDRVAMLDGDEDALIAHELAHQWFGDLLTCKSWEHIWLNEGFATYFEALWAQYRGSGTPGRGPGPGSLKSDDDAYFTNLIKNRDDVVGADTPDAPFQPGMASKIYAHPDDVFDKPANPYPKGGLVLHMLREKLGDKVFFQGLATYVDRHRNQPVETYQFRRALEDVSGLSLQRFFDQWVVRPGVPSVKITTQWDASAKQLRLSAKQTQRIDGFNPAFALDIPVWVMVAGESSPRVVTISMQTNEATASIDVPSEPAVVAVDPRLTQAAAFELEQPVARWITQTRSSLPLPARVQAVRQLGSAEGADRDDAVRTLDELVRSSQTQMVKTASVDALAKLANAGNGPASATLVRLVQARTPDAVVRAEVVKQIGHSTEHLTPEVRSAVASDLAKRFETEESYGVRSAIIGALGRLGASEQTPTILRAVTTPSRNDVIRVAAIEALARLDARKALSGVLERTRAGNSTELRVGAIRTLQTLAGTDPKTVVAALGELVKDPVWGVSIAAGTALSELGGPQAIATLEQFERDALGRWWKAKAAQWLREVEDTPAWERAHDKDGEKAAG